MQLTKAENDLARLLAYLVVKHGCAQSILRMQVVHSDEEDERNKADPRGFCHVVSDSWYIYCSRQIEDIDPRVRVALLLHEFGHLYLPAMRGDESEVDVDAWIVKEVPEAHYGYLDEYAYKSLFHGRATVVAHMIQFVDSRFVNAIYENG